MRLRHNFKSAFIGLQTHKSRSGLTILGIVIGITAIILVTSIGQGAKNLILNQVRGIGSRIVVIHPGREPKGPSDFTSILEDSLKKRDLKTLQEKENVPDLQDITPVVLAPGKVQYQGETFEATTIGASEIIADILKVYPAQGTFFGKQDVRGRARVAVIGRRVKKELFGLSDALGKKIKIRGKNFRIIGILPPKGQMLMFNADEIVLIPYSTAQKYLMGTNYYNVIIARARSEKAIPRMVQDIKVTLRQNHNISNPDKDDFYVVTQADAVQRVGIITNILTFLLVSIAAISLVVGGIGIMNIMLVSVTERTREIGLRKAIGATRQDIMTQFLFEAVILTALGGAIGIAIGASLSFAVSIALSKVFSLGWSFSLPIWSIILGFGVSSAIGVIFGLYPARQASRKSPIEALRYE